MPQIFHPSTNTLSRLTIYGALGRARTTVSLLPDHAVSLPDAGSRGTSTARAIFPRTSCARAGDRLSLLPYLGGNVVIRGLAPDLHMHELPLADLGEQSDARAGADQPCGKQAAGMDEGP